MSNTFSAKGISATELNSLLKPIAFTCAPIWFYQVMSPARTRVVNKPAKKNRVGGPQRNRPSLLDQDDQKSDQTTSNSEDELEFGPPDGPHMDGAGNEPLAQKGAGPPRPEQREHPDQPPGIPVGEVAPAAVEGRVGLDLGDRRQRDRDLQAMEERLLTLLRREMRENAQPVPARQEEVFLTQGVVAKVLFGIPRLNEKEFDVWLTLVDDALLGAGMEALSRVSAFKTKTDDMADQI